jgi:hypothetical protein
MPRLLALQRCFLASSRLVNRGGELGRYYASTEATAEIHGIIVDELHKQISSLCFALHSITGLGKAAQRRFLSCCVVVYGT